MSIPTIQFINPTPLIYITDGNGFGEYGQIVMGANYSTAFNKEEAKEIAAWLRDSDSNKSKSVQIGLNKIQLDHSASFINWGGLSLPHWACSTLTDALDAFILKKPFTGNYGMPITVEFISRGGMMQGIGLFAVYQKDPLSAYQKSKAKGEKDKNYRVIDNSFFRLELGTNLFVIHRIRTVGVDILRAIITTIQATMKSDHAVVNPYSDHITFLGSCRSGQPYRDEGSYRIVQRTPLEPTKTLTLMHDQGRFPGRIVLKEAEIPAVIKAIERAIVFFED